MAVRELELRPEAAQLTQSPDSVARQRRQGEREEEVLRLGSDPEPPPRQLRRLLRLPCYAPRGQRCQAPHRFPLTLPRQPSRGAGCQRAGVPGRRGSAVLPGAAHRLLVWNLTPGGGPSARSSPAAVPTRRCEGPVRAAAGGSSRSANAAAEVALGQAAAKRPAGT